MARLSFRCEDEFVQAVDRVRGMIPGQEVARHMVEMARETSPRMRNDFYGFEERDPEALKVLADECAEAFERTQRFRQATQRDRRR